MSSGTKSISYRNTLNIIRNYHAFACGTPSAILRPLILLSFHAASILRVLILLKKEKLQK